MKFKLAILVMSSILWVIFSAPALALEPDEGLQISIRRDWGFGMGGLIQGRFTFVRMVQRSWLKSATTSTAN